MFCGKCGKQIRDDSKFCEYCGAPVAGSVKKTESAPVAKVTPVNPNVPEPEKKKKTGKVIVFGCVGLIALLLAGGFIVKSVQMKKAPTSTGTSEKVRETQEEVTTEIEEFIEESESESLVSQEPESREAETSKEETHPSETAVAETEEENETETRDENFEEYLLPECDTRLYTVEELMRFSSEELRLARNEIYARHGRKFQTEDLNRYFSEKSWYEPRYSAEEMDALGDSVLNAFEVENRNRIVQTESALKGERPMQVINCQKSITLRSAPSTTASEICQLPLGATVTYKGAAEGSFYQIEYDGMVGYALGSYFAEMS